MMPREDYVAHRLGEVLYETWGPSQVRAIATLACEAVDEWIRDKIMHTAATLPPRRDHTVDEARAYRSGVEDVTGMIEEWEKFWGQS